MMEVHAVPTGNGESRKNSSKSLKRRNRREIVNRRIISERRHGDESGFRKFKLQKETFKGKRYVFRQDEVGDFAYIVEMGTVEIVRRENGKNVVLGRIGPGGMFGEMALIDDQPRIASAKTVGPVTVSVISREEIARKIAVVNPFTRGLIAALSHHVRNMAARLEMRAS